MEPKKTRKKKKCLLTSKLSNEILSLLRSLVAASDPCTVSKAQRCHFLIFRPFCFLSCCSTTSKSKLEVTSSSATSWILSASFTSANASLLRIFIRTSLRVKSFWKCGLVRSSTFKRSFGVVTPELGSGAWVL